MDDRMGGRLHGRTLTLKGLPCQEFPDGHTQQKSGLNTTLPSPAHRDNLLLPVIT